MIITLNEGLTERRGEKFYKNERIRFFFFFSKKQQETNKVFFNPEERASESYI